MSQSPANPKLEEPSVRRKHSPARRAFYIVFLIVAAVVLYAFAVVGATPFKVPTASMMPTLLPGDFLFSVPQDGYHRGDVVVLEDPLSPGGFLVKRVVGVGGDTIAAENGYLAINGAYASEPYLREPMMYEMPPRVVPEGEIFVLGDNRNESDDASRWLIDPETGSGMETEQTSSDRVGGKMWKRTVSVDAVVGKVVYIYLPFERSGPVLSYPLTNVDGK